MFSYEDINFYLRKSFETIEDLDQYSCKMFRIVNSTPEYVKLSVKDANYDDEMYDDICVSQEEFKRDFYSFGEFLATSKYVNDHVFFNTIPEYDGSDDIPLMMKYADGRYCIVHNDRLDRDFLEMDPRFQMGVFEKVLKKTHSTR
ncbi:MAG: hypothetical protein Q4C29_02575 [bacterium]|nr:hypothetical protein [bacterium]